MFRDSEAGLDYAQARSYQVRTGRFSSPDPIYGGLFEPQRWNRYAYANSNPVRFVDPEGLQFTTTSRPGCRDFPWQCIDWNWLQNDRETFFFRLGERDFDWIPPARGLRNTPTPPVPDNPDTSPTNPTPGPTPPGPTPPPSPPPGPPERPETECTRTGFSAWLPDFVHYQLSGTIPNPLTKTFIGVTLNISLDRFGNSYFGVGPSIGKTLSIISSATTVGWIQGADSQARTTGFLSGSSHNVGAGGLLGGGVTYTPGVGAALELGAYTPQGGYSYAYTWMNSGGSSCR